MLMKDFESFFFVFFSFSFLLSISNINSSYHQNLCYFADDFSVSIDIDIEKEEEGEVKKRDSLDAIIRMVRLMLT